MADTTVGIVGLGLMGRNIAARLSEAGLDVVGHDINPSAMAALEDLGGERVDSPAAVAKTAGVVITSLPRPEVVEAVYLAKDGVIAGADTGTVACEMSTIDPGTTRRIGEQSGELALLDTPVSGGPEDAARGTLLVIAGGDRETFEATPVQSVLGCLGREVFHAGDLGAGHTVKLLNNVMSAGNLLLAMEAIAFGVNCGIDGAVLYDILTSTGGSSNQLEKRLPRVLNRNFEPGFSAEYARKDVGLAVTYADDEDVPLHLASAVHRFLVEASNAGYGDEDMCGVVKLFERFGDEMVKSNRPMDESYEGY